MKIQEVTIEGYQSHVQSTFSLSPGLTVITGPSDAGKTAIIRALRWFAFNEPTGEAFLHTIRNPDGTVKEAVDQAKVSVTFDNGVTITKTRRKGKTSYTHSSYPTGWEKAEVPPEIKETLGLLKQEYGDFETCLNFAFQLDPPFLLSETASVGAKVLGKLAGTEIVDRSISEVNKKTHQTRTDISYADKQIGEIDVSLIEYFDLDTKDEQLKTAEEAFTRLQEKKQIYDELAALMNTYEANTERRTTYFDRVENLAGVVVVRPLLETVIRDQQKTETLDSLMRKFWKAVQDQDEPLTVLRLTRNLSDLDEMLIAVEDGQKQYTGFVILKNRYKQAQETIQETSDKIVVLDKGIGLKSILDSVQSDMKTLDVLKDVNKRFWLANIEEMDLRKKVGAMDDLDVIRGTYEVLVSSYGRLETLNGLHDRYAGRREVLRVASHNKKRSEAMIQEAEKELHDAWEAAGGVCPLCGSEVENESI